MKIHLYLSCTISVSSKDKNMTDNFIKIRNLKGIGSLNFEMPKPGVHVITASNGSGKTTLMACIERLKNSDAFRKHFIRQKSTNVDTYDSCEITYESKKGNTTTYTYRKSSDSWRSLKRDIKAIKDFGYSDVVTIPTLGKRVYVQSQVIAGGSLKHASISLRSAMSEVLEDSKFDKLMKTNLGEIRGRGGASRRNNTAFILECGNIMIDSKIRKNYYSETSFSLGEIFTLNLLFELEAIKSNSLLVIDELEVALHPRVQINLLRYIEKKAIDKKLTVIISTHSSSLIKSANNLIFLEKEAQDNNIAVHYNCYPTLALQEVAIEEDIQPDYVFFVEDESAELLLKAMIKTYFSNAHKKQPLWKVLPIGGYPEVLRFAKNSNQYLLNKNIGQYAFLDNDVKFVEIDLRIKANKRTDSENILWNLFSLQHDKIKYLDITPELGIYEWIKANKIKFNKSLKEAYPDTNINVIELLNKCDESFPNTSKNPRDDAKNRIKWIIS